MNTFLQRTSTTTAAVLASFLLATVGCGKSNPEDATPSAAPPKPQAAATELQHAFVNARPEVQKPVQEAAQALQSANYEQAIKSLETVRVRPGLTPEQNMAIHNSSRSLETRLIAAMEAGDPNAKRAYEMLKKSRRQ